MYTIYSFSFNKGKNWATENVSSVFGLDTVTANHVEFWFCRFRFSNFDVKNAQRSERSIVENVDYWKPLSLTIM